MIPVPAVVPAVSSSFDVDDVKSKKLECLGIECQGLRSTKFIGCFEVMDDGRTYNAL